MKKVVLLLLLTFSLISGVVTFRYLVPYQFTSPARFLPEDTIVYMHLHNPNDFFDGAAQSAMWREIKDIDFIKLALDLEVNLDKVGFLRNVRDHILTVEGREALRKVFNKGITLAILPDEQQVSLEEYLSSNTLLFAQPKQAQLLIKRAMAGSMSDSVTSTKYGSHVIYRLQTFLGKSLSLVAAGQQIVLSFNERTLRRALDRFDDQQTSLEESFFFQEFNQSYGEERFFSYVNLKKIQHQWLTLFPDMATVNPRMHNLVAMMQGMNAGAYWFNIEGELRQDKITIHYNEDQLKEDLDYFLDILPAKDIHFRNSPQDTFLYFWTNTFDMNALWDLFISKAELDPREVRGFEEVVALTAGVSYEDLLGMVGNHFHFIMRPPSPYDPVPLPNFTIIFNLADKEKAKTIMQKIFLLNAIPHNFDIYRDIPFIFWGHYMQNGLQPVYAFYQNSIYFSTSVQTHLEIVNTLRDRKGLTSTYDYNMVSKPLFGTNNAHGFIQIPKMVDVVKELISIGEAMHSRQNRKSAYKTKKIVYSFLFPLLDGLKTYSSTAVRSYNETGKLIIETRSVQNKRATEYSHGKNSS